MFRRARIRPRSRRAAEHAELDDRAARKYFGPNCGGVDNQEGYTDCPDALNFGAYDKNNVLPYYDQLHPECCSGSRRPDLAVTIGYTGNRGRHAVIPIPFNEPAARDGVQPGPRRDGHLRL